MDFDSASLREECIIQFGRALEYEPNCRESVCKDALIIFNLFSLEGYHIADAFGVPCVCVSPHLVPYKAPGSMISKIEKMILDIEPSGIKMDEVCGLPAWVSDKGSINN